MQEVMLELWNWNYGSEGILLYDDGQTLSLWANSLKWLYEYDITISYYRAAEIHSLSRPRLVEKLLVLGDTGPKTTSPLGKS